MTGHVYTAGIVTFIFFLASLAISVTLQILFLSTMTTFFLLGASVSTNEHVEKVRIPTLLALFMARKASGDCALALKQYLAYTGYGRITVLLEMMFVWQSGSTCPSLSSKGVNQPRP